jgi:hypothetical protein
MKIDVKGTQDGENRHGTEADVCVVLGRCCCLSVGVVGPVVTTQLV